MRLAARQLSHVDESYQQSVVALSFEHNKGAPRYLRSERSGSSILPDPASNIAKHFYHTLSWELYMLARTWEPCCSRLKCQSQEQQKSPQTEGSKSPGEIAAELFLDK